MTELERAWAEIDRRFPDKASARAVRISPRVAETLGLRFEADPGDHEGIPLMRIARPSGHRDIPS